MVGTTKINREEVLKRLRELKPLLGQKYGVVKIGLFGSVARGDNTENSDVDLLVKVEKADFSLMDFVSLKRFLEDSLKCRVDLVMEGSIKPRLEKYILDEVVYV